MQVVFVNVWQFEAGMSSAMHGIWVCVSVTSRSGLESQSNSDGRRRKDGRTEQAGSLLAYSNKLAARETEASRPSRNSPALGFHMAKRKKWVCHQGSRLLQNA